ncbi:MAG: ATP-binding protein [Geothrix sp.]|nr:ATP-binding protein [Geothrix sp.]
MEHFAIIQALCRVAMSNPSEAVRRQVERLVEALKGEGNEKQAKSLSTLLSASEKRQEMAPSRIRTSRAMLAGEELTRNTALPVDRETSVPLVQVYFPDDLPKDAPYFEGHIREAVTSVMEEWQHFDRLEEASIKPARTCLIYGPPGTGKTHLALWMAGRLALPVVVARLDGLVSSFLGTTSRNIGSLFSFAGRYRCLLLLDEFDAIAKLRNDPQEVGEIKRVVNTLLQHLDSRSAEGFTIGITNHDGLLDPAVWRRFEIQLQVPNPSFEARVQIIQRYLDPLSLPDSHVKLLAWFTGGSSGAELESLVRLIKKNHVLRPAGKNFLEDLKLIALMSSGRITHFNRDLLFGEIKLLLIALMSDTSLDFTQTEIAQILNRDKSTVSRMLASNSQDGAISEVSHG